VRSFFGHELMYEAWRIPGHCLRRAGVR
jgi:hypothetical protein